MFGPCLRLLQGLRGSKPQPLSQGLVAVLRKFVGDQQQQRPMGSRAVNLTDLVNDDLDEWRNPVESEIALPSTRPRCCLARDKRIECATTVELVQHRSSTKKRWRSAEPEIRAMAAPSVALDAADSGEMQRVSVHVSNGAKIGDRRQQAPRETVRETAAHRDRSARWCVACRPNSEGASHRTARRRGSTEPGDSGYSSGSTQ